ncbi:MAG: hypothetical protein K2L98_02320 [Bacilli bacterium]|nr:hypothetical protein [Bacilli bacterium]
MGREIYKLKVSVEVLSFFNETKDYTFSQGPLEDIDKKTYIYQDAQGFFNANRKYIEGQIRGEYEREHGYFPTGINLGENGIYIIKGDDEERPIVALFKKINVHEQQYELSDIIKKKLYKGNIKKFYECDQFREALGSYDSFFYRLDSGLISRIITDTHTTSDVVWLWDWISDSKRICPLMRFLLMDLEHFDGNLNEYYFESIPARENPVFHESRRSNEKSYSYRPPYKDD